MLKHKEESAKIPSKEEMIKAMREQIELKSVQVELHELNMRLAEARAREIEAIAKINHFTNPPGKPSEEVVQHTVTQEDLDNNPEMSEAGIQVGQVIGIPKEVYDQFTSKPEGPKTQMVREGENPKRNLKVLD